MTFDQIVNWHSHGVVVRLRGTVNEVECEPQRIPTSISGFNLVEIELDNVTWDDAPSDQDADTILQVNPTVWAIYDHLESVVPGFGPGSSMSLSITFAHNGLFESEEDAAGELLKRKIDEISD